MEKTGALLFAGGVTEKLLEDVERLEQRYYNAIDAICYIGHSHAIKLKNLEVNTKVQQYISLCHEVIEETTKLLIIKKEHLIPYLRSLFEKDNSDHDCRNCNGGGACNLNHNIQLSELKESHKQIRAILNKLQSAAIPDYSETVHPDIYSRLRIQIALLADRLTDLLFVEETYLIPQVITAQNHIHAGD